MKSIAVICAALITLIWAPPVRTKQNTEAPVNAETTKFAEGGIRALPASISVRGRGIVIVNDDITPVLSTIPVK